jgi:hypothetical protein
MSIEEGILYKMACISRSNILQIARCGSRSRNDFPRGMSGNYPVEKKPAGVPAKAKSLGNEAERFFQQHLHTNTELVCKLCATCVSVQNAVFSWLL